jgi:hypothetical protein
LEQRMDQDQGARAPIRQAVIQRHTWIVCDRASGGIAGRCDGESLGVSPRFVVA